MQVTKERELRDVLAALSEEKRAELVKDSDNPELIRYLDPETRNRWSAMSAESKRLYLAKVLEEAGSAELAEVLRQNRDRSS
jgi:hypothetical protein